MKKITLKIGTAVILNERLRINKSQVFNVVKQIAELSKRGYFFYIVSSGAGGFGKKLLKENYQNYNPALLTSIGQLELMSFYKKIFAQFNLRIAQLLLTKDLFETRRNYENLKNLLKEFSEKNIIPIINENDPLSFGERSFGENDSLAVAIAIITNSPKLILLSTVDGVYKSVDSKEVLSELQNVNREIERRLCFEKSIELGRGGMITKLRAAKLASLAGIETFIINGLKENSIKDLLLGKKIGTKIIPLKKELLDKQKWMLIATLPTGKLFVDKGAKEALLKRKSLLAVGIIKVSGRFQEKDFINICDFSGEIFAIGKVNYSSGKLEILNQIKNKNQIKKLFQKEVVHSNNLVLLQP